MCRILPLVECGVNNAPSEDEPPRASLIREIYAFLDCYVSFTTTSISSKLSVPLLVWWMMESKLIVLFYFHSPLRTSSVKLSLLRTVCAERLML